MSADPPDYPGEGHGSAHHLQSLLKFTLGNKGDIPLGVDTGRTGNPARGGPPLFHSKDRGNCLTEELVNCFLCRDTSFIFAIYFYGTNSGTVSTPGTLFPVHVGSLSSDEGGEVAYLTRNLLHFRVGQKLYVLVLSRLHHLGGHDALRTVQRRKYL
ncbi:hypothetical protein ES703_31256 [subsurface metagenome]